MLARHLTILAVCGTCLVSVAASAQRAGDLADLVGARAAGGETQLQARGYSFVTTNTVRDTKWAYWYNDRARQCVQVATANGRYTAINRVPDANCRRAVTPPPRPDYGRPGYDRPGYDRPADRPNERPRPDDGRPGFDHARGDSLTLICYGSGSGPAAQSYSGYSYNSRSRRFEPQYGTTLGQEGFASDVQVEIWRGRGRIHLTGKLVPPIHSRGEDGWWQIENLVVTPDRITGRYRMNGLNKPRIDIDRRTRVIRINAATSFTGRCDAGDWRSQGF